METESEYSTVTAVCMQLCAYSDYGIIKQPMERYRSFSFGSLQGCSLVLSLCALIATLFQILQRDENDNVGLKPMLQNLNSTPALFTFSYIV